MYASHLRRYQLVTHKMASPILLQRTYRLSQVPDGTTTEEIRQLFPSHTRDTIQHLSLARAPGSTGPDNQVSTVTFRREPRVLGSLPYKFGSPLSALLGCVPEKFSRIWIDAHFHGFTALNNLADECEVVEYVCRPRQSILEARKREGNKEDTDISQSIVALTGLGGKAFASWQCYDGSMWLRDHIPLVIANARTSIYGYSSDVGNSDSISTLSEMTEAFVMDLVNYGSPGPLGRINRVRLSKIPKN
jgi:hypothetical protein